MDRWTRLLVLVSAVVTALVLVVTPVAAAEGGGAGDAEEREKIELPSEPRDQVGLVILIVMGIGALVALDNARRQLKGERRQATGEWRWR